MSFSQHVIEFAGRPVVDFPADPEQGTPAQAADPGRVAWRLDWAGCGRPGLGADRPVRPAVRARLGRYIAVAE